MILKILLLIIFIQLFLELFNEPFSEPFREGLDISFQVVIPTTPPYIETVFDNSYPDLGTDCSFNVNIKKPFYDQSYNLYTNKNNTYYTSNQNILKAASNSC